MAYGLKIPALAQQMNAQGKQEWTYIQTANAPLEVKTTEQLVKLVAVFVDGLKKGWHIDSIQIEGDVYTLTVKKVTNEDA